MRVDVAGARVDARRTLLSDHDYDGEYTCRKGTTTAEHRPKGTLFVATAPPCNYIYCPLTQLQMVSV